MRLKRVVAPLGAAMMAVACVVVMPGCEGNGQIPLANVPPPPEGFSRSQGKVKVPSTASPTNANDMRK